jgi:large subunit ribosomal protein L36
MKPMFGWLRRLQAPEARKQRSQEAEVTTMKVRSSVRSLARKPGSVVVRRRGRVVVVNRKNPRWNGRQG